MHHKYSINDLSVHLFWDLDRETINFTDSKYTIIHRVLEYGTLQDWKIIKGVYGLEVIKNTSLNFRGLDPVTLSFLAHFFSLKETEFRCYASKQSAQNFWSY